MSRKLFGTLPLLAAVAALALLGGLAASSAANATSYNQGFETDTSGWVPSNTITRTTASPGPSSGSWYADTTNLADDYQTGYGTGGYTYYGGRTPYAGATTQSLDIYIDPTWAAPTNPGVPAFWLDMSPANQTGAASNFDAESNFQFIANGSSVTVNASNVGPIAQITTAGWYTFQMMFSKGVSPTDPIVIALSIFDSGTQLGSTVYTPTNTLTSPTDYQSQYLGSGGYAWLTVWQNGFAGDVLHIDNANQTIGATPLPAALPLFASGAGVLGYFGWRRKKKAAV